MSYLTSTARFLYYFALTSWVGIRTAFAEMWKNPQFLADYSRVIKTEPIFVSGSEGQAVLAGLGSIRQEVKDFLVSYIDQLKVR